MLRAAGWNFDDRCGSQSEGRVEREHRFGRLQLDYALFVGDRLVGAVEVKNAITSAGGDQARQLSRALRAVEPDAGPDPVVYLSNGAETIVLTGPDAEPRDVATFHGPEVLVCPASIAALPSAVAGFPSELGGPLPERYADALRALEASLAGGDRRALVSVSQGGGRPGLVVAETDRLLRHSTVRRVLVLVDRLDLANQFVSAFDAFEAGGQRFSSDYEVALAESDFLPLHAHVCVMTAQRLVRLLDSTRARPDLPINFFDFVWAYDPERLGGQRWERMLDYFDAPLVGVTGSPTPESYAFFDGNLVATLDPSQIIAASARALDVEAVDRIFAGVDRRRGEMPAGEALSQLLTQEGLLLGWRELAFVSQRLARRGEAQGLEPFVVEFLAEYFRDRQAKWAVDPLASSPYLLSALVDAGAADKAVGFVPSESAMVWARALHPDDRLAWTVEDLIHNSEERAAVIGRPDLIASALPIGVKGPRGVVRLPGGKALQVGDDLGHRLLLQSVSELADDGEAAFVVADSFFRDGPGRVRRLLGDVGAYVHAVIALRQGLAQSHIRVNLVFISRLPSEDVFVGELSSGIDRAQLLSQLLRRRRGPVAALGRLVPWEDFDGFARVFNDERAEQLLARLSGEPSDIGDLLFGEIGHPRKGQDFEPASNAVYLPTFTSSIVFASREALTSKPWGYFQIPLDPSKALAEYVASFLNTTEGRALRECFSGGEIHPSISMSSLRRLRLPLPDLELQRQAVALQGRINALRLELDGLERRLNDDPGNASAVSATLDALGAADPMESFRDALPFPLASILWRYEADGELHAKVGHLHGFFEGAAMYFAGVLWSAFAADQELQRRERGSWFTRYKAGSFNKSNFGAWTRLGGRLAASVRACLEVDGDRERILDAFAVGSELFAKTVATSELWEVLDEARDIRNKEKGHGGIAGPVQYQNTHAQLFSLLTRLGTQLSPCLDDVMLIRPGAGTLRRGVTTYARAELLQGRDLIFRQTAFATLQREQLEGDELYLASARESPVQSALHLLPLIRLKAAPASAQTACYFYASLKNGDVEFISHHFEDAPRVFGPDPEVVALITDLKPPEQTE